MNSGILTNPVSAGTYTINGDFTSVDPDTDGATDNAGESPLSLNLSRTVDITSTSGNPTADVKVNGSDGPVALNRSNAFILSVSLDPGGNSGANADWWVAVNVFNTWYYYNINSGWSAQLAVTYQGPMSSISSLDILNAPAGLPAGAYTFYFGVDLNMDGSISNPLYSDSIVVNLS